MPLPTNLRPTPEQYAAFASYLPEAHSWYKHLPLLTGRRFVVFVAPDAGLGRLVARLNDPDPKKATACEFLPAPEGPEFTEEHPRIHYGWQTTREYRQRFGYLDYMSRISADEPYGRDASFPVQLPDDLDERCGFILYPYVHPNFAEAITWDLHDEAIEQLEESAAQPGREQVLELKRLAEQRRQIWDKLSDGDRDQVFALDDDQPTKEPVSDNVVQYNALGEELHAVHSLLREPEIAKIRHALQRLDEWLLEGS